MTSRWIARLLVTACILCLIALASMAWSVLVPMPVPVMLAMSFGQGLGALSFLCYVAAVLLDLRRRHVLGGDRDAPTGDDLDGEAPP